MSKVYKSIHRCLNRSNLLWTSTRFPFGYGSTMYQDKLFIYSEDKVILITGKNLQVKELK